MASYTKSYGRQIHFDIFELKKKKDYRNEWVAGQQILISLKEIKQKNRLM